jgi:hypothetical protein
MSSFRYSIPEFVFNTPWLAAGFFIFPERQFVVFPTVSGSFKLTGYPTKKTYAWFIIEMIRSGNGYVIILPGFTKEFQEIWQIEV